MEDEVIRCRLGYGRRHGLRQRAIETASVGRVGVHSPTPSTAFVGRDGDAGATRETIRKADRMVVRASGSGSPAA